MKQVKVIDQRVKYDDEGNCVFIREYSDGMITVEPITPEEAAELEAEVRW